MNNRIPELDVVLSSRVRLARNFSDIPFAPKMSDEDARKTIARIVETIGTDREGTAFRLIRLCEMPQSQREMLVEHHLISFDLLKYSQRAAALISTNETLSVMVNEEDHIRIQGLLPGMQLERAADMALHTDDILGSREPFAFDEKWGFLTCCPANTGTGMRASFLIHLPALRMTGKLGAVVQAFGKIGLIIRGLYGDGNEARGNLYLVSNQVTLGRSEEDVIKSVMAPAAQLLNSERLLRRKLMDADADGLTDRVMRSNGILQNARLMSENEFMDRYSDIRLGACLGLLDYDPEKLDRLMMDMQPSSLSVLAGREMNERELDLLRADELRVRLTEMEEK